MSYAFLNVVEDGIAVKVGRARDAEVYLTKTGQQFVDLCDAHNITELVCSSSLDHPREYTTKEHVVQMANLIRGNDV